MIFFRQSFIDASRFPVRLNVSPKLLTQQSKFTRAVEGKIDHSHFGGSVRDAIAEVEIRDLDVAIANNDPHYPIGMETPAQFDASVAESKKILAEMLENDRMDRSERFKLQYRLRESRTFDGLIQQGREAGMTEEHIHTYAGHHDTRSWEKRDRILDLLKDIGVKVTSDPFELTYVHMSALTIKGKFNETDCDVVVADRHVLDPANLAMMGDAPINCVAMGQYGDVWAHPDFERDLNDQKYRLRVKGEEALKRGMERFERLKATRYPKLEFSVMNASPD